MLLICIYQYQCTLEVVFGRRYRHEHELMFAPAEPRDKTSAMYGGTEAQAHVKTNWTLRFIGAEVGAEASNPASAACSPAHSIMLVSVLIRLFQGLFEL